MSNLYYILALAFVYQTGICQAELNIGISGEELIAICKNHPDFSPENLTIDSTDDNCQMVVFKAAPNRTVYIHWYFLCDDSVYRILLIGGSETACSDLLSKLLQDERISKDAENPDLYWSLQPSDSRKVYLRLLRGFFVNQSILIGDAQEYPPPIVQELDEQK